jgi:Galactose-3-O-sulfotransferase
MRIHQPPAQPQRRLHGIGLRRRTMTSRHLRYMFSRYILRWLEGQNNCMHRAAILLLVAAFVYVFFNKRQSRSYSVVRPSTEIDVTKERRGWSRGITLHALSSEAVGRCVNLHATPVRRVPTYVFFHLHKTAGNNLKVALFGFAKRNGLMLYHTCRPTSGEAAFKSILFRRRKRIGDYDCNLLELAAMSDRVRNSFDFVVGHQYMGIHRLMLDRDVRYFTFVRHPLARKVSHYIHFQATPGTFVKDGSNELDRITRYLLESNRNYMTKRLSAITTSSEILEALRSRLIDSLHSAAGIAVRDARRNLDKHFFFVGVQERYAESLCVLAEILNAACYAGHRGITGKPLNASKIEQSHENERGATLQLMKSFSERVQADVLRAEALDLELYKDALQSLEVHLNRYPQCRRKHL